MYSIGDVSAARIQLYYVLVFLLFLYSIRKYYKNQFHIFIVFVFFLGMFVYLGKAAQNSYRIIMALYALYMVIKFNSLSLISKNKFTAFSFFIFSLTFLLSSFFHHDKFTLIFSQYSLYFLLFTFFLMLKKRMSDSNFVENLNRLFYFLIILQIVLSIGKFLITGPMESIVGSMCYSGGAYATTFPVLGFIFLWMYRKGNFTRKDWIFIAGLMLIGFVNYKRAIWYIMPVIIALFMFYIQRRKIPIRLKVLAVIIIPFIFYLGVRLNPTLNREQKVWGSFDLNYARNYAKKYTFGGEKNSFEENGVQGRGGVFTLLTGKLLTGEFTKEDWSGFGLTLMYIEGPKDDKYFSEKFNINSIGAASGFMQSYVVFGFIGVFVTLLFALSLLLQIKNRRLRYTLIGIFFWEYFLYAGAILREPAFSFLLIYIILYSNHREVIVTYPEKTTITRQ